MKMKNNPKNKIMRVVYFVENNKKMAITMNINFQEVTNGFQN